MCGLRGTPEAVRQRQGGILAAVQAQQRALHPQGQHRPQAAWQLRQLRLSTRWRISYNARSTHGHTRGLIVGTLSLPAGHASA